MIQGELLLSSGRRWQELSAPDFFGVVEALRIRQLGRENFEKWLEDNVAARKAAELAAKQGRTPKAPARVMSIEKAKQMQADAQEYDAEMTRRR